MSRIRNSPPGGMGHACEMETSILLAIRPEQVSMNDAVDEGTFGRSKYEVLDMLRPQPYFMARDFHELSASGTLGMPSLASAEKGEQFLAAITDAVIQFLREFAGWTDP
jgi:creatinine amidohydrolase